MNEFLRVAIYVNIRLSFLCFSLCRDIINFEDILLVSFFNNNNVFWLMNIYCCGNLSQIRYSLVVILELNSVSWVQYKNMMIDR